MQFARRNKAAHNRVVPQDLLQFMLETTSTSLNGVSANSPPF
jgi:hypothetical protein